MYTDKHWIDAVDMEIVKKGGVREDGRDSTCLNLFTITFIILSKKPLENFNCENDTISNPFVLLSRLILQEYLVHYETILLNGFYRLLRNIRAYLNIKYSDPEGVCVCVRVCTCS